MTPSTSRLQRSLPAFAAALPMIILFVTLLSVPLAAAQKLALSAPQTASWIMLGYGLPGLLGLALALRYRQPLLLTGNIFALIFVGSLAGQLSYAEIIAGFIVAGASVALAGPLGLTGRLAAWIPAPVVLGLLAGAIMPFVSEVFTSLAQAPALVGSTFLAYLVSRRFLGTRVPAILPALLAGLAVAAFGGQFGQVPGELPWPAPVMTTPDFSLRSVATVTPVLIVVIALQSNIPSVIFLRSQGYQPPERLLNAISGLGTLLGSVFGPAAVSISLPATSLVAGAQAGKQPIRHRSVYVATSAMVLIALLAGVAADVPAIIPMPLLISLAGLAMVGVLANALGEITRGPLRLGPLFAFAIALSDISLLGFGSFFWALVIGTGIAWLVERDALTQPGESVSAEA